MDVAELLDHGIAWTAARIAAVPPDRLDLSTPCSRWNLEELLDHTIDSLEMLEAKTAGNLTEIEEKLLTTALANLRPLYEKAGG